MLYHFTMMAMSCYIDLSGMTEEPLLSVAECEKGDLQAKSHLDPLLRPCGAICKVVDDACK